MKVAAIDIGTNTTLLLVAAAESGGGITALAERAEITRLGRGIGGDGRLGETGIARTLAALREFAEVARGHGARIAALGTEALRRAPNAAAFLVPAREALGVDIEVIDGAREAMLTFRAVTSSFPEARTGNLTVVDIGGGSTEIVIAADARVSFQTSLPVGSVRLTERFFQADPPAAAEVDATTRALDEMLAAVPFPPDKAPLVGVAGTVTTLGAMVQALPSYDAARVHGYRLARGDLGRQIDRLRQATQAERERIPGLDPRRADVILAGALILDRLAQAAGVSEIRVSDRGIRWGLVYEMLEARSGA